ncbi:MAG: DUF1844 domain-containing protein [Deltaproteobacteria bacterium]|nr:DUF1844 domain-containing protein [Deltaproteobacteria bacterium]MBW2415833.1 DUF1844 domain-containing protein [Deltaproteobacteria bacterium]
MHDPASTSGAADGSQRDLPAPTFATFVLSLSTSALLHMGVVEDPEPGGQAVEPDLQMARHTIDLLEMIQEKTRGNLEPEEEQLLSGVLHDLHMHFVEAGKD